MKNEIKERKEYVIKTSNPFVDARGRIDNYELVFPVNMANIITSESNTLRANHYHPEQLQQVLIISGKYISVYKDLTNPDSEIKNHIVQAGDLVVTPPMVAHTMIFLEKTIFVNLVSGNRDHDKFGIHTVPYELVKKEEIGDYIKKYEVNN
jgi:dTDP-4-dehydrorhamnose 3,5-epimerase-like enzyme